MQPSTMSVLVSHRVPLVRAGLVAALSCADQLQVRTNVGESDPALPPDRAVLVTDLDSALEIISRDQDGQRAEGVRILTILHEESRQALGQAWRLGARSFASLQTPGEMLIQGVEAIARGRTFCCPSVHCANARGGDAAARPSVAPRGGLAPTALRRVCAHIDEHLAEPLALDTLAALAQLSAGHFARAFRQSVGVAPHRYINLRRVEAASARIRGSDAPLAQIARDTGFVDQSHFTRLFAMQLGETPSAFRRRHR